MITINNKDVADIVIDNKNVVKIQDATTLEIMWIKRSPSNEYFYIENDYNGNNTISITTSVGTGTITGNHASQLEYSKDKENWTTITLSGTNRISMNSGEKVYFRNNNGYFNWYNGATDSFITKITCSEIHSVGGNINNLLDYTDDNVSYSPYCFYQLFKGNSKLTKAENLSLPATTLTHSCYHSMFRDCTSLTSTPTLPAMTLATSCYSNMFYGCTSLTTTPTLPATTLANYCYTSMFAFTNITSAPTLPATTLKSNCYSSMFWGCSSLTTAPTLPAMTLAISCYYNMFCGCSSLTTPPSLPATTLSGSCYQNMFKDCTALTVAPNLPVTTLEVQCYARMLSGCTSLTTAPALPATTLVSGCYFEMFRGCTSLNDVTTYANDVSAYQCTYQWLSDVASSGTFYNYGSASYTYPSSSGIPQGWRYVPADTPINDYLYVKNEYNGENIVTITEYVSGGTHSSTGKEYWSKDNGLTWNSFKFDNPNVKTKTFTLQMGEFIHFKTDDGGTWNDYDNPSISWWRTITCSQSFSVGGNIKSVFLPNRPAVHCNYGFVNLFKNSTNLIDASELDLSNLSVGEYCFSSLFYGCTGLTKAPILTLQTLVTGCYFQMFEGCTSLDEITSYASDISAANCIYRWLRNVSPTGTFHNLGGSTYTRDSSGVPSGWTIVNS